MRCQIVLINGEVIGLEMSWAEILSGPGRLGEIRLDAAPGVTRIIPKSSIVNVFQFTEDAWKTAKDDAEVKQAAQEKQRAEAEAKRKSDAAAATLALLESKTLKGKIRKLFKRTP